MLQGTEAISWGSLEPSVLRLRGRSPIPPGAWKGQLDSEEANSPPCKGSHAAQQKGMKGSH